MNPERTEEHERQVLAGVMLKPETIMGIMWLNPEDFYKPAHRRLWTNILNTAKANGTLNFSTAAGDNDQDHNLLAGYLDIDNLDFLALPSNITHFAGEVRQAGRDRRCLESLHRAAEGIQDGSKTTGDVALELTTMLDAPKTGVSNTPDEVAASSWDKIEKYQSGESEASLSCGLVGLDIFAPDRNQLVIIAARPSIGKTALAVFVSDKIAMRGERVIFESIEMTNEDVYSRRLSMKSSVPMTKLRKRHGLTEEEYRRVGTEANTIKHHPILPGSTSKLYEITAEIREAKAKHNISAAFIDYLQIINTPKGENRNIEVGMVTRTLAALTKEIGITIFLLSQMNRAIEGRGEKTPQLSDLRDSGSIEQDADCVWFLHRPVIHEPKFLVYVAKNRNGPVGVVELQFDPSTGHFWDSDREPDNTQNRYGD